MNFLSHIMISKELYRHFSKEKGLYQWNFYYGCIKPDLFSKCLQKPHTLDNYIFAVSNQSKLLINQSTSPREFSESLGIICHYICDFFCYYHLNTELHHKLLRHFCYEVKLHMILCSMLHKRKIRLRPSKKKPKNNIASLILEMRKEYFIKRKTSQNDIEYAFLTSIWACESIFELSKTISENTAITNPA